MNRRRKRQFEAEARLSQQILNTTADELARNRRGQLSDAQRAAFPPQRRWLRRFGLLSAGSALATGALLGLTLLAAAMQPGGADVSAAVLALSAACATLTGTTVGLRAWRQASQRRARETVAQITDRALLEADPNNQRYLLILPQSSTCYVVPRDVWAAFDEDTRYHFYVTDSGRQLIAVEEVESLPPLPARQRTEQIIAALPRGYSLRRTLRRRLQTLELPPDKAFAQAYRAADAEYAQNALGHLTRRQRWRVVRQTLRNSLIFVSSVALMALWIIAVGLNSGNPLAPESLLAYGFGGFFLALLARREWRVWQSVRATLDRDFRLVTLTGELTGKTVQPTIAGGSRYTAFIAGEAINLPRTVYDRLRVGQRYRINVDPRAAALEQIPVRAVYSLEPLETAPPAPQRLQADATAAAPRSLAALLEEAESARAEDA